MLAANPIPPQTILNPPPALCYSNAWMYPLGNKMNAAHQSIDTFLKPLVIEQARLAELAVEFSTNFKHLAKHSTEQFLATPVNVLPHGKEQGRFLAIDVGGSNLRVGLIELLGVTSNRQTGNIRNTYEQCWPIEDHLKADKASDLFDWIGDCIVKVVTRCIQALSAKEGESPLGEVVPIGITFSFPMIQTSIAEAKLMKMGKGFAMNSNLNLGELVLAGYKRHLNHNGFDRNCVKLPEIKIAAITNDAVATLASLAYSVKSEPSSRVAMGLIVGTGTNATTVMKLKDLHASKSSSIDLSTGIDTEDASVAVNTEWSIRGSLPPLVKLELLTKWDSDLDRACDAPGFQPLEYMSSGRYLGELVRLIFFDYLVHMRKLDQNTLPEALRRRNGIATLFLSGIVAPAISSTALLPQLEAKLPGPKDSGSWKWTPRLAEDLMVIARKVQIRAAHLTAAATIGALVCSGDMKLKGEASSSSSSSSSAAAAAAAASSLPLTNGSSKREELVVAYAGGVIERYPGFLHTCQTAIDELVESLVDTSRLERVSLRKTENGGIIGAGVLAGTVWNLPSP